MTQINFDYSNFFEIMSALRNLLKQKIKRIYITIIIVNGLSQFRLI